MNLPVIGETVSVLLHGERERTVSGTIAYILLRGEAPTSEDFQKYWQPGKDISEKHVSMAKEPSMFPRVAIEYKPGAYLIIPWTKVSSHFDILENA